MLPFFMRVQNFSFSFYTILNSLIFFCTRLIIIICNTCYPKVFWRKDLPSGELNFFSVSEDGTVCQWILMKHEMIKILRMSLVIDMYPEITQNGLKQIYYGNIFC